MIRNQPGPALFAALERGDLDHPPEPVDTDAEELWRLDALADEVVCRACGEAYDASGCPCGAVEADDLDDAR